MEFFYQSGALGFDGKGWAWHKVFGYEFPTLPTITKTMTYFPVKGKMFLVFPIPFTKSVWNRIGLVNPGLIYWVKKHYNKDLILSLYIGSYEELIHTIYILKHYPLKGVELNISCPNIKADNVFHDITWDECIESIRKKCQIEQLFLKVRHDQNLNEIKNLHFIDRIHINSIPSFGGGVSGRLAQKKNWSFISKWQGREGIPPIAGCSWINEEDLDILKTLGCEYIGIGSIIITKPKEIKNFVQNRN